MIGQLLVNITVVFQTSISFIALSGVAFHNQFVVLDLHVRSIKARSIDDYQNIFTCFSFDIVSFK